MPGRGELALGEDQVAALVVLERARVGEHDPREQAAPGERERHTAERGER